VDSLFLFGPSLVLSATILLAMWEEGRPPRRRRLTRDKRPRPLQPVDTAALQDRPEPAAKAA
jgi:hypothetical protein